MKKIGRSIIWAILFACIFILIINFFVEDQRDRQAAQNINISDATNTTETILYNGRPLPVDKNRYSYDLGTLRTLKEDAAVALLYMNDDESDWDPASMNTALENTRQAMEFIKANAAKYGYHLTLPILTYGGSDVQPLTYDGVILTGGKEADPLTHAARSMGFQDKWAMHEKIQEDAGMDQIIYIVAHNKEGYSYAQADQDNDENVLMEHCVIANVNTANSPGTYAHEIMHLFGAQDFYEKERNGKVFNTGRSQMAASLFPTELMLNNWLPISEIVLSDFTAFCVGWLDVMPENYDCDTWWEDTQERAAFPYSIGEYNP